MKTKFTILTTLFFLLSTQYLTAQPSVSFYFTTAFPVNEYQQLDNEVGYGGNLEIFFISPSKPKPLGVGVSLSYIFMRILATVKLIWEITAQIILLIFIWFFN
ncbi:MAG: hypothetical protein MUE93_05510 [Ignavibacteriaceae bacterium]|nr:hypothetical protein [Ignavibacteriaceae bacterium]